MVWRDTMPSTRCEWLLPNKGNVECRTPWQVLEGMLEGIQDEVEALTQKLQAVRSELAPWEAQTGAVQSRIDVAVAERDFLLEKQMEFFASLRVPGPKPCPRNSIRYSLASQCCCP